MNPHEGKQLSLPDAASGGGWQGMNASYLDPIAERLPQYAGRWLAGVAPVGNPETAVIVQQRYDQAIPPDSGIMWSGAAVLLCILLMMTVG